MVNLNIGIIGAGNFAAFAAEAFLKSPAIKLVAVTDINRNVASKMGIQYGLKVYNEPEDLLANNEIDLVYIATPPFLHYAQSKMALLAGKHVICEKPAALKASEAEELATLAQSLRLLYVVNLMQRYNSLYEKINKIVHEKILGKFLHGFFENYASDENLGEDHWFWNESKSGGIFIEHGIHFFDMFSGWLGEGEVLSAVQLHRNDVEKNIIDRVQATVLYKEGIVNFYHGFDQPKILDRQEMRLQFEFGDITLYEWIPTKMKLHGLLQKGQLNKLQEIIGVPSIFHHNNPKAGDNKPAGKFSEHAFEDHITMEYKNISGKQNLYQQMLTAMISDQFNWIRNPEHVRVIDSYNAVQSLKMAEEATLMAQKI